MWAGVLVNFLKRIVRCEPSGAPVGKKYPSVSERGEGGGVQFTKNGYRYTALFKFLVGGE